MKGLKQIGKAFVVAFSMYSKIPMPRFVWGSEDMRYHLCFFPWVGAVIGAVEAGFLVLCKHYGILGGAKVCVGMALVLLLTGGFHLDGYLDTVDARCSYQDKERKLAILSDPHIGAFSVIHLAMLFLFVAGGLWQIERVPDYVGLCMGFVFSRIGSGICVLTIPSAKKQGMLKTTMDTASKRVLFWLVLEGIAALGGLVVYHWQTGMLSLVAFGGTALWFAQMCKKEFGGITGDLAGYYVVVSETVNVLVLAISSIG
ncbi:cobalamin-5'-phosphate synthase [Lachnospiraceae bacterium XBB1006]|nr:cobalamin-5'-phosphate synthase [Lachnospiraceae bacterium XBB1006]